MTVYIQPGCCTVLENVVFLFKRGHFQSSIFNLQFSIFSEFESYFFQFPTKFSKTVGRF